MRYNAYVISTPVTIAWLQNVVDQNHTLDQGMLSSSPCGAVTAVVAVTRPYFPYHVLLV